jgi:hypothetical protein
MSRYKALWICLILLGFAGPLSAQIMRADSIVAARPKEDTSDYTTKVHRSPRKATIRSAILPGWGQLYNRKYWKAPIVWGGLTACVLIFKFNLQYYNLYRAMYKEIAGTDTAWYHTADSVNRQYSPTDVQFIRNYYRQNLDYSVLAFIAVWGLNVIDATVDAHLHEFDVTDNLTLSIEPRGGLMGGYTGVGLVLDIHPARHKLSPLLTNHLFGSP